MASLPLAVLLACGTAPSAAPPGGTVGESCTSCVRAVPVPAPADPAPAAPAPAAAAASSPEVVRVVLAGDVLLHEGLWATAANDARKAGRPGTLDFAPIFGSVRRLVARADLAVCHLETPVARPGGPFRGYPRFAVPPRIVVGLRDTGFDVCTTASNHSLDQGQAGVRRTLRALDGQRIRHVGTARTRQERRRATTVSVRGMRIALLSYTYGTNGIPVDADRPWSVNLLRPARIRADARAAKRAGAEVVLVALHWGDEYRHAPTGEQLRVARALTRSPYVDLVYGHHAHVVQPVRRMNRTWVVFGLGNLIAQQNPGIVGVYEGIIAQVDLVRRPSGRVVVRYAGYRPTYISRYSAADPAMRVIDIDAALARRGQPAWLRAELVAARRRVAAVVWR